MNKVIFFPLFLFSKAISANEVEHRCLNYIATTAALLPTIQSPLSDEELIRRIINEATAGLLDAEVFSINIKSMSNEEAHKMLIIAAASGHLKAKQRLIDEYMSQGEQGDRKSMEKALNILIGMADIKASKELSAVFAIQAFGIDKVLKTVESGAVAYSKAQQSIRLQTTGQFRDYLQEEILKLEKRIPGLVKTIQATTKFSAETNGEGCAPIREMVKEKMLTLPQLK